MLPTVGTTWRSHASNSLYRIVSIDLSLPGDCVSMRLVEPSRALLDEWAAQAEQNRRYPGNGEPTTFVEMHKLMMGRLMMVDFLWFERAGTFVGRAA